MALSPWITLTAVSCTHAASSMAQFGSDTWTNNSWWCHKLEAIRPGPSKILVQVKKKQVARSRRSAHGMDNPTILEAWFRENKLQMVLPVPESICFRGCWQ